MAKPDWRAIYQASKAEKVERYKKMRHDLGQSASDKQIDRHAAKEAREGIKRAIKEHEG